ncbi:MAG: DUF3329 domain-containing protein [Pseudomonadota bacterium]
MFNLDTPFFRPLWRRALTLIVCFGWGLWELANGAPFWAMVFGALGGAAAWQFYTIDWAKYDAPESEEG